MFVVVKWSVSWCCFCFYNSWCFLFVLEACYITLLSYLLIPMRNRGMQIFQALPLACYAPWELTCLFQINLLQFSYTESSLQLLYFLLLSWVSCCCLLARGSCIFVMPKLTNALHSVCSSWMESQGFYLQPLDVYFWWLYSFHIVVESFFFPVLLAWNLGMLLVLWGLA